MKSRNAPPRSAWRQWLDRWLAPKASPDATQPAEGHAATPLASDASGSKAQRLRRTARREHLYAVVRENMIQAGVLSSAYKFKVLTLDHDGMSHVVLIDIQRQALQHLPDGENTIETSLQQLALERLGLEVRSVYWRALGKPAPATAAAHSTPAATPAASSAATETVGQDEVQALKEALNSPPPGLWDQRHPEFEPTRPMPRARDKGYAPLSDTQLGDLD